MSDSVRPYGLQPTRLLCPQDSPSRILEWVARHGMKCMKGISPLLECSYNVVLVSDVQQSEESVICYLLFFQTSFPLDHHGALNRVPCHIQQVLISYLFYTQQCIYVNSNLPIYSTLSFPLGIHKFVLYVCVSISALQTS